MLKSDSIFCKNCCNLTAILYICSEIQPKRHIAMQILQEKFRMLLDATDTAYVRDVHDRIAWDDRLVSILGARGIGKTTLVLQHIKLYEDILSSLYVSADDLWFSSHTLYELADVFYKNGGKALYIDEIHKYRNWAQEIKNIYDSYPRLRVAYTGSSILDLKKGESDLSRRLLEYSLYGLSFREYLALSQGIRLPQHSLEQVLQGKIDFPYSDYRPIPLFKAYLKEGYYPYFREKSYYLRLNNVINRVVDEDIPRFAGLSAVAADKLKTLLYIVAQSVPFKPNYSKIAEGLGIHRNSVAELMLWLDKAGLVSLLREETQGIRMLGKVNKVYLDNPNLAYALSDTEPDMGNLRETAFFSGLRVKYPVKASPVSDFKVGKYTFEVGGKSKGKKQVKEVSDAYVVKDDIEYGSRNIVPLWAFGLLY